MMRLLIMTAALATAVPLAAQPAAIPGLAADPARQAAADRLAMVVAPDGDVPVLIEGLLKAMIAQLLREEPEMAEMEAEFPGLFMAMTDAWRPILLKVAYQVRPLYRAELSQLYQANLTADEASQAADFLSQPDVQGYFSAARAGIDYSASLSDAMAGGEIRPGSLRADVARASTAAAKELTPQLERKLSTFFGSPLGRKLIALNPKKAAIDARWANYTPPGGEAEIEQATLEAMLAHIAKTDPELAETMREQLEAEGALAKKPG